MSSISSNTESIVKISDLKYSWSTADVPVLDIPQFNVQRGEKVFLRGASGSGKTTLLSLIAAVLKAQQGSVCVNGINTGELPNRKRDRFRSDNIGFIFQQFNLLPFLSVMDNVSLPCRFSRNRRRRALESSDSIKQECLRLLQAMQLPLTSVEKYSVMQLSVGQQQRVAVARALIGRPPLVIADEPTSALDADTRDAFINLLFSETESAESSLLFVSHDNSLATHFDRQVELSDINNTETPGSAAEFAC